MNKKNNFDVLVVGGGPAGCSAGLWLSEMGFEVAIIEKSARLLSGLLNIELRQNWVLGDAHANTADLARRFESHVRGQPGVRIWLNDFLEKAEYARQARIWNLTTHGGRKISCRAVLVCTGVLPQKFNKENALFSPWNAADLTMKRDKIRPATFLLLGGGDNAVENAVYLSRKGHRVTLWSRSRLRAGEKLVAEMESLNGVEKRIGETMPHAIEPVMKDEKLQGWRVSGEKFGCEFFDYVAVLFGNRPNDAVLHLFSQNLGVAPEGLQEYGVFAAGDVSGRWHPCISTAIADGAHMARQIQMWLQGRAELARPAVAPGAGAAAQGQRLLTLTGLRFAANLGILAHEKTAPQPIQVDAELNLGAQPLRPCDDDITHVLDYRKVRQIIIDECTAEHVNLLETLIGKLCQRLMRLPGVRGVRVKIAKLEIFDDCEVAIRMETGQW